MLSLEIKKQNTLTKSKDTNLDPISEASSDYGDDFRAKVSIITLIS